MSEGMFRGFVRGLVLVGLCLAPVAAQALPKVALSIGQGAWVGGDETAATAVQGELTGSWSFAIVQLDLGLLQELNKSTDLIVTPGVRVNAMGLFVKLGAPLRSVDRFDWGLRLGAGWHVFSLGIVSLFLEVDAFFWEDLSFKDAVPITVRMGGEVGF